MAKKELYMRALILDKPLAPLVEKTIPIPDIKDGEILIKVKACAVCRTDLHIIDGELDKPKLPLILGHEICGVVAKSYATKFKIGERVGVPWLAYTCQNCYFCKNQQENLCPQAKFTGYTIDGGFAQYTVANHRYVIKLPENYDFDHASPLLCAGLIGYRSYKAAINQNHIKSDVKSLGIYGFGAAAHIIAQIAINNNIEVFAFVRPKDHKAIDFAHRIGVKKALFSNQNLPHKLDAAIIYAPVGNLIPKALQQIKNGKTVVCAGIHMSDIPKFPYNILWGEKKLISIANLTTIDAIEFFQLAEKINIKTKIKTYPLSKANEAIRLLRDNKINGAIVLKPND